MSLERPAIWACLTSMTAISVDRIGKTFRVHHLAPASTAARRSWRFGRGGAHDETLWAVRDVSFDIPSGEMFGLIGANGSGKSTLLQVIAGIHAPDAGSVTVNGRLRALLELGTGFNSELTGRQNVFLNASLHGFRRADVRSRFDEIVAFAELEQFIDMPLKTYSSGMRARLGFSIATAIDPDVLLVDEVLATGDQLFREKSRKRIEELIAAAKGIVLVTHDLTWVTTFCNRAMLLEQGHVVADGEPGEVVAMHQANMDAAREAKEAEATRLRLQGVL